MPPLFHHLQSLFRAHFPSDFRGSHLREILCGQPPEIPRENSKSQRLELSTYLSILNCINDAHPPGQPGCFHSYLDKEQESGSFSLEPTAQPAHQVKARGVIFAPFSESPGNSQVIVQEKNGIHTPAQIEAIYLHTRPTQSGTLREFFFTIRRLKPLAAEEKQFDPYLRYSLLDVALYRRGLLPGIEVIRLESIVSHFASCPMAGEKFGISGELQVVLSLDRVRLSPPWCNSSLTFYRRAPRLWILDYGPLNIPNVHLCLCTSTPSFLSQLPSRLQFGIEI